MINKVYYNNSYMYVYKYSVDIYLLCMIRLALGGVYLQSVENVITMCKLIGLLFCPPSSSLF